MMSCRSTLARVAVYVFFGVLLAGSASAQAVQKVEVAGGYSYLRDEITGLELPLGWVVDVAASVTGWLAAAAELGASHRSIAVTGGDLRFAVHNYMIGGRASARIGRLTEFAHLMVGLVQGSGSAFGLTTSGTVYGIQPGGGVEYPMGQKFAVRAQVDFRWTTGGNGIDPARQVRFAGAIACRLWSK